MKNQCYGLTLVWESGIIKNMLLPTCEIMSPYVEDIYIAHCGPRSQVYLYDNFRHLKNVHVLLYDYKGEAESVMNFLAKQVPENSWAYFFDSDHRPTYKLISNLNEMADVLDKDNCGFGSLPTVHHEFRDDGTLHLKQAIPPKDLDEVNLTRAYTIKMFAKITKSFRVRSHKGMHYSFDSDNHRFQYFPYSINHCKLYFEYYSSIFLSGYTDPTVHSFKDSDKALDEINKHHYRKFDVLKRKYNMLLSNDFKDRAYSNTIPQEFIEFFSNPAFLRYNNPTTSTFLDHTATFCTLYKFSFKRSFEDKRFCGNPCCLYNGIQL